MSDSLFMRNGWDFVMGVYESMKYELCVCYGFVSARRKLRRRFTMCHAKGILDSVAR